MDVWVKSTATIEGVWFCRGEIVAWNAECQSYVFDPARFTIISRNRAINRINWLFREWLYGVQVFHLQKIQTSGIGIATGCHVPFTYKFVWEHLVHMSSHVASPLQPIGVYYINLEKYMWSTSIGGTYLKPLKRAGCNLEFYMNYPQYSPTQRYIQTRLGKIRLARVPTILEIFLGDLA